MSNASNTREHLHGAIQGTIAIDEELPEGTVLTGWVTVAEWMAPNGDRWLSRVDGGPIPDKGLPAWQSQGYLYNALFEGFIPDEDED